MPNPISLLIHSNVVELRSNEKQKVVRADCNQNLVSPPLKWFVVVSVDVLADDATRLHCHVVHRTGHGTGPDCASVTGSDCNEDSVNIWVTDEES